MCNRTTKMFGSEREISWQKTKFMNEFFKVIGKNNRILQKISKTCEYWYGEKGKQVTYSTCKLFKYHDGFLKDMFRIYRRQCPNLTDNIWKCVHYAI